MYVNEQLRTEMGLGTLENIKCLDCLNKNILNTVTDAFGHEDHISDQYLTNVVNKDKRQDPLSDSIPDKNKLSKSEKSLKVPLQIFQQEQKKKEVVNDKGFIRTTKIEENKPPGNDERSNTDATRTQTHMTNYNPNKTRDLNEEENIIDSDNEHAASSARNH